ncbi:apoptosis inhibitor 5-like protein API5 [Selaginella moellendorffii]|uniref:apoptosis inhibitor 5-like protein API5 n=1 Tax=Selaginella moellendorffii TaxID=88036 RepID=UPI000D1CD07A|nr:apoptosis inhibitor 5-like protein API5 [Selaginella moellendorffii]XP_024543695.1 apoptosis inhibitor 5-like protein API5 [Selaginella moellendorffii]XP_024543698.1 apoptosis inhibitor 5-like protein API5 [Selaginella moellendorffii]|eukprot:XP_024543688.1 apoptosis inhibitor 5-like protein API5 [Selaginella moellendorffii]
MASETDENSVIAMLYEYGERLSNSEDKSKNESDYLGIIEAAKSKGKVKQLAAQLIPRYFKYFPNLSVRSLEAQLDLCEEEELGITVQAVRGLATICKDSKDLLPKVADVLGQLLITEEPLEKDAVQKALMSILRQDAKATLTALFKHVENSDENLREKVLAFIREKVFPLKNDLLQPQEEMERHVTDLIKKSLQDVTGAEFKMFMEFLKSLSIFGEKAPQERVQELLEIVESQADLDSQFKVEDTDHIDRLMACLFMSLPFYARGASNSKFLNYINKSLFPAFDKLPEDKKTELLKKIAESVQFSSAQDARNLLPTILQLLKKYMPKRKTTEEFNYLHVECLLYAFHQLAHKSPNSTNSLCGYKIVTGQPSDRLGEDFTDLYKDFIERLEVAESLSKSTLKKLTQGMTKVPAAKDENAKAEEKAKKVALGVGLRSCNNITKLITPLKQKTPEFLGGPKNFNPSWKEAAKPAAAAATATQASTPANSGAKRPAAANNGATTKRARGEQHQHQQRQPEQQHLVNKAFAGISRGGGGGGGGRRQWRAGRGRGRNYY